VRKDVANLTRLHSCILKMLQLFFKSANIFGFQYIFLPAVEIFEIKNYQILCSMSDFFSINENYLMDKELLNEASYKLFAELFNEK